VVTFGRVLREAGLEIGPGRIVDALKGLDAVDITRQDDVYWTLRATLVTRRQELEPFDRAFNAWFLRAPAIPPTRLRSPKLARPRAAGHADPVRGAQPDGPEPEQMEVGWSATDLLRQRDFGAMTHEEFAQARRLLAELAAVRPQRRTRRLVVLCDISGSMEAYTRGLLLFLHAAVVVIVSDGWERQDPGLVGREIARLARTAYAVVWVSPLKGHVDYQPLGAGMNAALPYIDRFLAGHNIASLEDLAEVLAGIERRHATSEECNRWRLR
jgi:uncharacterized protein with von Willebrand factor type A (vWA) domain